MPSIRPTTSWCNDINLSVGPYRQRGIVLLVLAVVLFMAGTGVLLTVLNSNQLGVTRATDTLSTLREARDTLVAYAIMHGDYYGDTGAGPGHLPCPDTNGNGAENNSCNANAIGRLPESVTPTFGPVLPLSNYDAEFDQQFWYAVATPFRRNPQGVLNTTVAGTLSINGQGDYAAVLIAPGDIVGPQRRRNNNPVNYLDGDNTASPDFITADPSDPTNFNDLVIGIRAGEILTPVSARVAETIKIQLDTWHDSWGGYPVEADFVTAMAAAPDWLTDNQWLVNTTYVRISNDSGSLLFAGCNITYTLDKNLDGIDRTATTC